MQRAAVIGLALLSAIIVLHSILNSNAVRSRLRDRVEAALAARLGGVELGSHSDVDWSLRLSFGPVRISPEPGSPVVLEMERVRVRPRWAALLAGRLEPGLVQMRTVVVRPGTQLEGLRALAARLTSRPSAPGKEPSSPVSASRLPRIEVQDLRVELVSSQDGHPLDLGAWDAQVEVSSAASARVLEVVVQREGGGEARSVVRWARDQPFQVEAGLEGMPLRPLIELLGQRVGVRATAGSVTGRMNGVLPTDLKRGELEVSGRIDGLFLEGSRLASEPVGPWRLSGAGTVDWDRSTREVRLRDGHIGFGENDSLRVNLEGVYEGKRSPPVPRRGPGRPAPLSGRGRRLAAAVQPRRRGAAHPRPARCPGAGLRPGARSGAVGARREAGPRRPARGREGDAVLPPRAVHLPPGGRRRAYPGDLGRPAEPRASSPSPTCPGTSPAR